jgi:leucyl-tRNA synthetase
MDSRSALNFCQFKSFDFGVTMSYNHLNIENKWQNTWDKLKCFETNPKLEGKKFYALDMFPYPSASGLHVGHALGYTATDIISRMYRMKGYNVLHPMGWDAFGLPAEQHAIETGEHPAELTYRNIDNYKHQLKKLGMAYDWSREFATCDPKYYKHTQKIFKILYEKGLAYQTEAPVNWCPALKTVLANDEVIDGKSERGGHPVVRVPMRQWMLKITDYAERLLQDLDQLDWPDSVKEIQRNWIGKSVGAEIHFEISNHPLSFSVFTTRPDTIFGVSYVVLATEHPLVKQITTAQYQDAVTDYVKASALKSEMDRTELNKTKTGVFTGSYAIHPVSKQPIPIWIGDYVLMSYGTGALMAVPGHDERDHEFALKYNLPILEVVRPITGEHDVTKVPYTEDGILVNSDFLNQLNVTDAKTKIITELEKTGKGRGKTTYKLRDWLFSRQRYWGEPIPVLKQQSDKKCVLVNDHDLPVTLPKVKSYEPTDDGQSPLGSASEWIHVQWDGTEFIRETDTMPGAAGSSWYFLRYTDPHNANQPFDFDIAKYWMPVDLYIGGQEHAVGHLLYSRFWTKVLFDARMCPVEEPFKKLVNQGMICKNGTKMSKSKKNGVNPDEINEKYGADSLRVYEMFMGPLHQTKEWEENNLAGMNRFLARVYRLMVSDSGESLLDDSKPKQVDLRVLHKTIKKVSMDIEGLSFNTAIAAMMIFLNHSASESIRSKEYYLPFLKILNPFAPHITEEIYQICYLNGKEPNSKSETLSLSAWPEYIEEFTIDNEVRIGVQVNGKHRGEISISKDASQEEAVHMAKEHEGIRQALAGQEPKKVVYVKGRILNFVV